MWIEGGGGGGEGKEGGEEEEAENRERQREAEVKKGGIMDIENEEEVPEITQGQRQELIDRVDEEMEQEEWKKEE